MTRLLVILLLLAGSPAGASTFTFARSIPNPTPAGADFFGSSLALTGTHLLVGARFDDPGGITNAGTAFLFDLGSAALLRTFAPSMRNPGDQLGFAAAAIDADFLVSASDSGTARAGVVYRFGAGADGPLRTYAHPVDGAKLGYAVAALGSDVLAGAPFDGSAGGAYVFDGASGTLRYALPDPTPDADDLFGRAVAGAGTIAAVAAPFDDAPAANGGVVHLFSGGTLLRTLTSPQPNAGDEFGLALAADGNRLLVGAPYDHATASAAGAAYLFDATTGTLLRSYFSPEPDARFGAAVAISGDRILIGAPFVNGAATDSGAAYVFEASTGTLLDTLVSPSPHAGDQFGATVALDGPIAVVGAWLDDTGAENAGAVYEFVDVSLPTTSTTTSTSSTVTTTSVTTTTSTSVTTTTSTSVTTTTSTSSTTDTSTTSTTVTTTSSETPSSLTTTTGTEPQTTSTNPSSEPGAVSTTTLPSACPCDDADPCTVDACVAGTCTHDPLAGFDGVVCRLDLVDAALHGPPLADRRLTARLQAKLAHARNLVEAARRKTAKRTVRRADRALRAFIALVKRSQRAGRIAHAVADDLIALSSAAATQLAPLR